MTVTGGWTHTLISHSQLKILLITEIGNKQQTLTGIMGHLDAPEMVDNELPPG